MKIAVLSDIHGNLTALQAVLADIDREGVDTLINCGDILGGPLASARTADLLMARAVPMIAGNHDRQLLTWPAERLIPSDACTAREINASHRAWLATAPPTAWLSDEVFACHGTPQNDLEYWLETVTDDFGQLGSRGVRAASAAEVAARLGHGEHSQRASLILCGHTHVPRVATLLAPADSPRAGQPIVVVNPGSVGLQAYDDVHPHLHHIENGSPHARYAIVRATPSGWHVDLRCVPYDVEPMAQLADARQRPDWSIALRTGRMIL